MTVQMLYGNAACPDCLTGFGSNFVQVQQIQLKVYKLVKIFVEVLPELLDILDFGARFLGLSNTIFRVGMML